MRFAQLGYDEGMAKKSAPTLIRTSITLPIDVYQDLRAAAKAADLKTPSRYLETLLCAQFDKPLKLRKTA